MAEIILQSNFESKDLLTQHQIDLSQQSLSQMISNRQIKVFIQNTYKNFEEMLSSDKFEVPPAPQDPGQKLHIKMIQVDFSDQVKALLQKMYLNEYPTLYLLHEKFEQSYKEKNAKYMLYKKLITSPVKAQ